MRPYVLHENMTSIFTWSNKKDGDELVLTLRHVKRTLNDGNHVVKYGYEIFHIM